MTSFGTELNYSDNSTQTGLVLFFPVPGLHFLILTPTSHHVASFHPRPPSLHPRKGCIETSPSSTAYLPVFPAAYDTERRSRRGIQWARLAPSLLSDRPQSQSLPLSGAEVYTHGKLIPAPCLPHIALMSKVVRRVESRVTFSRKTDTLWEAITLRNNTLRGSDGERPA